MPGSMGMGMGMGVGFMDRQRVPLAGVQWCAGNLSGPCSTTAGCTAKPLPAWEGQTGSCARQSAPLG